MTTGPPPAGKPPIEEVLADLEPRIRALSRRWGRLAEPDDTAQAARMGVMAAYERWVPDRDATMRTWCWRRAQGAVLDHVRSVTQGGKGPRIESLTDAPWIDPSVVDGGFAAAEARMDLAWVASFVTPQERVVMDLLTKGLNQAEAARHMGLTEGRITQLMRGIQKRVNEVTSTGVTPPPPGAPKKGPKPRVAAKLAPPEAVNETPLPEPYDAVWWENRYADKRLTPDQINTVQAVADGAPPLAYGGWNEWDAIADRLHLDSPDPTVIVVACFRLGLID